jgi:hypothetical protein
MGVGREGWAERVEAALDLGDRLALRRVGADVPAGRAERDRGLGVLAQRSAAGSVAAFELLAELVDELGLRVRRRRGRG